MKNIIERIAGGAKIARYLPKAVSTRLAVAALAALAAGGAWAGFKMTNPVTGKEETYTYKFVGTTHIWNGTQYWQDSDGATPSAVPGVTGSNLWDPILFDASVNSINITAGLSVEGWNLRMGLYNGANVQLNNLQKLQGGVAMWITVDSSSHCTIEAMANKKLANANPLCLYSANEGGIAWTQELSSSGNGSGDTAMPFHYYLAGNGTVAYNGGIAAAAGGAHVIKQADVTLSGTSQVVPKPLVSFSSSSTTFTAAAAIKVYDTDGTTLKKLVGVTAVRQSSATIADTSSVLTTADAVGTCEIVQCTDGIVLYYVDGAPSAVTGYKPSININFTNGNGLSTVAEVGLSGYAVLGTSWNNFTIPNNNTEQTFSTVASIDSTGVASTASGVSVTVSGHRGVYYCSDLDAGSNPLHGYVDEGGATGSSTATPTVTITGIPYANYRLIVYHSTDSNNLPFGYDTINGTDFTYVDGVQAIGTTSWGNSGASNNANPIAEGVNTLVSGILSGSTATMVAHRVGTANSASVRGCFAAIQVVEVVVSDTELVIPVTGATTYTVDADKEYEKVIISGTGTLTLDGTGTITTEVLEIENNSAIVMNSSRLAATTVIGQGTAIYDGEVPPTDKGWTDSANWKGTVWIKNMSGITGNSTAGTGVQPNNLGNDKSKVKFSGVSGWLEAPITYTPEIVLENDAYDYALKLTNGNSPDNKNNNENRCTVIKKLSGSGKVTCGATSSAWPTLKVYDASAYTGDIDCGSSGTCLVVVFAAENETLPDTLFNLFKNAPRSIYISADGSAKVASGATWTANSGITVNGTLYANGTLASSAASAVEGSGTVVFTDRYPTPVDGENETKWWKNTSWTGTVQIANKSGMAGDCEFNKYGNANSTLELNNVTGWVQNNYECTVPLKITGTLTLNNGSSAGNGFTIDHLKGSGTIYGYSSADKVIIRVKEWADYTGAVQLTNKIVIFGNDALPTAASDLTAGQIFISSGADVTIRSSESWWAVNGIVVNGTFTAADRNKWGGGTAVTVNETGVLKLAMTGNIDATGATATSNARYLGNIGGTGTILLSGTKWLGLPKTDDAAFMWASTLAVSNCLTSTSGGLVFTRNTTIGTLSGNGLLRSDLDTGGSGNRVLTILQSADSEWSGTLYNVDLTKQISVAAKQGATAKTLKLSGTQTATKPLVVEAATATTDAGSVNLTGTWMGDTTVSGTFGGTGTLTGALTFNAGSTFKAFASDTDGLAVSGTITYPSEGTVTVDVSALEQTGTKVLMTASGLDVSKFALASGQSGELLVEDNALKVDLTTYAAFYGGTKYPTVQEAINAAVQAGGTYDDVTILDPNATCPAGYYIDTEDNNALKKYAAAAVTVVGATATTNGFTTFQAAIDAAVADNQTTYAVAYADGTATASVTGANVFMLMPNGYDVTVMCSVAGYGAYAQGQEIPGFAGVYPYSAVAAAATFTWTGAAEDGGLWETAGNWSSEDGTVAAAPANSLYTAVLDTAATIKLAGVVAIGTVNVGAAVTLNHVFGQNATLDASSIVLTAAGASLAKHDDQNSMTLAVVPTTTVANSYVKTTTSGGTTTYTVATQPTVSDVAFEYGDDFATATVTATVSDAAPSYKLTVGGTEYPGVVSGSKVTFSNVATGRTAAYDDVSYEIAATSGSTAVPLAGDTSGSAEISDTKTWFSHNSSGLTGGAWSNAVDLSEGPATVEDNTFTATAESTSSRVVLEFNVCFSSASDADVDGTAQAAIKIGEVESAATFMVLAPNNEWTAVSNEGLTPDAAKTYKVVMTIDYGGSGSYGVAVDNYVMTNASGSASFPLAASKKSVQSIDFAGSGVLTSMKGNQVEGYMVVDKNGTRYATISDAIAAYTADPTIGPLTVLHDGTPLPGWSIVTQDGVRILKKLAKGFFFMAY